jgi:transcriptional regulator GlxA family with amidase domain
MARVLRFERATGMLRSTFRPPLAVVAAECGYADQAHMTREWVEFAGNSPTVWLAE